MDQLAIAYAPAIDLFGEDGDIAPADAARLTGKDPKNAARDIKTLAGLGYIERADTGHIWVTEKGKRLSMAVKVAAGDAAVTPGMQFYTAAELRPHPLNPRKQFEAEALDELRQSIVSEGRIISSLLVRPIDPNADEASARKSRGGVRAWIVAGERRYRAVCDAIDDGDLPEDFPIPCQVRAMDDQEHLRLAIAENLHRSDLNHVEQGEGFKALMDLGGETPDTIADKCNRSPEFVRQHLRILNLGPVQLDLLRRRALPFHQALQMERDMRATKADPEPAPAAKPELLETRKFDQTEIAPVFGVAPEPVRDVQPDPIAPSPDEQHRIDALQRWDRERKIDEAAVDMFAAEMKAKLATKRAEGRAGWHDPKLCKVSHLAELLIEHVAKGDPIDIANFAMMLRTRCGDGGVAHVLRSATQGHFFIEPPGEEPSASWLELHNAAWEAQKSMGPGPVRYRLVDAVGRVRDRIGIGGSPTKPVSPETQISGAD